jgi:hypothetical protein
VVESLHRPIDFRPDLILTERTDLLSKETKEPKKPVRYIIKRQRAR